MTRYSTPLGDASHLAVWEEWDGEEPLWTFATRVAAANEVESPIVV